MNQIFIIIPAIVMFTLTLGCMVALGIARFRAIHGGEVKISFFRTYNEGSQPQRLHLLSRHLQNHFEVPPLFYAVVILLFVIESVSLIALVLAWLFVLLRILHTYIHLSSNNISQRFFTFGASLFCLLGLWVILTVTIILS